MRVIKFFVMPAMVSLGMLHGAADDGTVNLIKIDGSCVKISKKAAQHSSVLRDRMLKYPTEHEVCYAARESGAALELLKAILEIIDESAQNLVDAEQNLGDSMLPEVRAMYKENASATLGCYMESDDAFATLAGIAQTYKVPRLNKALLKECATLLEARNSENIIQNKEFLENVLQQIAHLDYHTQALTPLQRQGMSHVSDLIRGAMAKNKKRVVKAIVAGDSSMKNPAIFFTGMSIGELIACAKTQPEYIPSGDSEVKFVIKWDGVTSLEGLRCDCDEGLQKNKRLRISDTSIDYLPSQGFMHACNPEIVMLQNNAIKEMHVRAFAGLSALTMLNLRGNKLEQLPSGVFDCLLSLRELNLSKNKLTSFNAVELLCNNACIKELGLAKNKLTVIPTEWPNSCNDIKVLDLSSNCIQVIPSNLFSTFKKLRELSVDYNQIHEVQPALFAGCEHLKELYIRDNPIPKEQIAELDEELSTVSIY